MAMHHDDEIKTKQFKYHQMEPLVSVIMPAYNCADFIGTTLDSVIAQTYQNWEILVVDDCSTDHTEEVIRSYVEHYPGIRYYKLDENYGPAVARNKAVEMADGKYLAFLDSDDIWLPQKLEKQIRFMREKGCTFTCTGYNKIDEQGKPMGRVIGARSVSNYEDILKRNPGNSTVMYDAEVLGKALIPDIRKRNDYVMWLQVIKKAKYLYGIQETLGSHRIRTGSLSRNKASLVYYHWKVYRDIEGLSLAKSIYLVFYWIFATVFKLR